MADVKQNNSVFTKKIKGKTYVLHGIVQITGKYEKTYRFSPFLRKMIVVKSGYVTYGGRIWWENPQLTSKIKLFALNILKQVSS